MAVFIASWESNPVERTVVSCVIGVCVCACEAPLPMQGRARSRRARGADDLRVCVNPLTWRESHDARSYVGGGDGRAGGVLNK